MYFVRRHIEILIQKSAWGLKPSRAVSSWGGSVSWKIHILAIFWNIYRWKNPIYFLSRHRSASGMQWGLLGVHTIKFVRRIWIKFISSLFPSYLLLIDALKFSSKSRLEALSGQGRPREGTSPMTGKIHIFEIFIKVKHDDTGKFGVRWCFCR